MGKVKKLRSLIYGKHKNEAQFAKSIGWNRQRLNLITNGLRLPDLTEVCELANGLGLSVEEITSIFLETKSPNGQQK